MKPLLKIIAISVLTTVNGFGQTQNNGSLRMHNGAEIGLFGDFTNNGTFTNNLGTIRIVGTNAQTLNGTNVIQANNFIIDKASNTAQLDNELQITGELTFTNGILLSDRADVATEFVHFLDGSTYSGASNASHINGVIRKTGDDAFTFPIGDSSLLRTAAISAPSNATDHFTAYYKENNPNATYSIISLDVGIDHVSTCEYWALNRTGGTSDVEVNLSWATNSCGISAVCDVLIARWDGAQWTSEGNGGTTGSTTTGTLVSGSSCATPAPTSSFGAFTLGSISPANLLPVELISFNAEVNERKVYLNWITVFELNNDYFTVQRSIDAFNWEFVEQLDGAGTTTGEVHYETIDQDPYSGISYYRLKQTDNNGMFTVSQIRAVDLDDPDSTQITFYPNPTKDFVTITGATIEYEKIKISNMLSQDVGSRVQILGSSDKLLVLDLSLLEAGSYHIWTGTESIKVIKL